MNIAILASIFIDIIEIVTVDCNLASNQEPQGLTTSTIRHRILDLRWIRIEVKHAGNCDVKITATERNFQSARSNHRLCEGLHFGKLSPSNGMQGVKMDGGGGSYLNADLNDNVDKVWLSCYCKAENRLQYVEE